jgi:phage-related protein
MARNEVRVTITGDAQGLKGALSQAEGQLGGFSSRMEAIGGKLRDVGQSMTLGLTLPIVGALGLGVKWAGELEDAQAMSQQVFGSMAGQMDSWAANSAQAFGLSSGDATEWANQMGIRLRQIGGMSEETAATTSQNLVQLAGDFASAFGGSVDDAATALGSALTGEFEPLKRYGVVINDAALKQKLFEMTGKEATGTLTAQEKQLATLALITEQASIVQGDYGRNAEGATNSQRTMMASLKDTATTLGTVLLPFVTKAAQFITELAEKFQGLSPTMQKVIVIGAVVAAALGPIIYVAGLLATAIGFIASPVGLVVAAIAALVGAFVYFYKTNEGFREWVNGVVSAVRDRLVQAFNYFKDEVLPQLVAAFQNFRDNVLPRIVEGFQWLFERAQPVFQAIGDFIQAYLTAWVAGFQQFVSFVQTLWGALWPAIQTVVQNVWPGIQTIIDAALTFIRGIIEVFTAVLSGDWSGAWEGIKAVTSGVLNSIVGIFQVAAGILVSAVQGLMALLGPIFSGGLNFLRSAASSVWSGITAIIDGAASLIRSTVSGIGSFFSSVWNGPLGDMLRGVTDGFNAVVTFVSGIPGSITRAIGNLGRLLYDAGKAVMNGLLNGIKDAAQGVFDFVSGIAGRIADLKGPLDYDRKLLIPAGHAIMDGLGDGLRDGFGNVSKLVDTMAPSISATVNQPMPTPQAVMAGSGGPSITVNVSAGVGDPSEIGRQVVDVIKAYEQRNGTYWRN